MKTAYILVGAPGSGKSTLREKILAAAENPAGVFVYSTDDQVENLCRAAGTTYELGFWDHVDEATKLANLDLTRALMRDQDVIWDQTNLGPKKRRKIVNRLGGNFRFECHCIRPPVLEPELNDYRDRCESRGDKKIPQRVIENLLSAYQPPVLEEGYDQVQFYNIYGEKIRNE